MRCRKMTNLEFNKRVDALRESSETKENFVCDEITENNLYDFILYEMFKGYDRYCDDIISTWIEGDEYDE